MNGMEMLYHILFVEKSTALWGIILLGVIVAVLSYLFDIGCEQNNE
jgi:hypothetical protein